MSSIFPVLVQCNNIVIVNLLIKTDSASVCVPCMLAHACCEGLSLKGWRFGRYLMLIG